MEPSEKPSPLESEFPLQDHYAPETEGEFPSPALPAQHPIHYDARAVVDYAFGEMKQG